jgi:hypothetical protein
MEKQLNKLPSLTAKIDLKCTGTSQHWVFGKPGDAVSGGIYVPRDMTLPAELTISFLAGSKEHERMRENIVDEKEDKE